MVKYSIFDNGPPPPLYNHKKSIHPIPLLHLKHQQKQYDSKINRGFTLRGYKHISGIAAVGYQTDQNLKKIRNSILKSVTSLEFDAYLCDYSGLKFLSEVLIKLRGEIKNIKLIIRRTDKLNELENVGLCLRCIRGLKRLELEIVGSTVLTACQIRNLGKNVAKCYQLEALNARLVFLQNIGLDEYRGFANCYQRLLKLKELKHQVQAFYNPKNEFSDEPKTFPKIKNVKNLFMRTGAKTGWTSMTDGSGQFMPAFFKSYVGRVNPVQYTHIFDHFVVPTEGIEEFAKVIPQLSNLRILFIEFNGCRLGELELMILAEGLANCKQVKKLTFKILERSQISVEYVGQFIKIVSGLDFLSSFDIFFRRLRYSQFEKTELKGVLSDLYNVESVLTNESLHIFKKDND